MGCVKIFVLFIVHVHVHVYGYEAAHGADEFYLLLGVTPKPGQLGPDIYSVFNRSRFNVLFLQLTPDFERKSIKPVIQL